ATKGAFRSGDRVCKRTGGAAACMRPASPSSVCCNAPLVARRSRLRQASRSTPAGIFDRLGLGQGHRTTGRCVVADEVGGDTHGGLQVPAVVFIRAGSGGPSNPNTVC